MRFLVTGHTPTTGRPERRTVQAHSARHAENLVARAGLVVESVQCLEPRGLARLGVSPLLAVVLAGATGVGIALVGAILRPGGEALEEAREELAREALRAREEKATRRREEALTALREGDLAAALAGLRAARDAGARVDELLLRIEQPLAGEDLVRALAELPLDELEVLAREQRLPAALHSGFDALDAPLLAEARTRLPQALVRRARRPDTMLEQLRRVGLWPEGTWERPEREGPWRVHAMARRGENAVRATLTSLDPEQVRQVSLELSMLDPYGGEDEALALFARAARTLEPDPSLAEAVEAARPWVGRGWLLERRSLGGAAYVLELRNR